MPSTRNGLVERVLACLSIALLTVAVALGVFCWWGLFTAAGRRHFDEMAGLIPFYAGICGVIMALGAVAPLLLIWWRRHRRRLAAAR